MNKSLTVKVVVIFLSLFIIITVSSQIYFSINNKHHTENAVFYTVSDTISFKGIFVRNETVIDVPVSGVLNYIHPDGSKIAKSSVVAEVYHSEADIEAIKKIAELEAELKLLERAINPGVIETAQPDFIAKQIDEKYILLENYVVQNDFEKISSTKQDLLMLMSIYNLVTTAENKSGFSDRISQLENEIASLQYSVSSPLSTITTEVPGYFVSYTDGYESSLNFSTIDNLSYEQIKSIISKPVSAQSTSVGKIIDGYSWKMIGIINISNRFIKDKNLKIRLSGSLELIPVTVEDIKETDNPDECIIVLSCDLLNYQLVQNRVSSVDLVFEEFSGIKVDRTAMRFNNGEKGVYIALGQNIIFKKLDVIYEGEDYVLSKLTSDTSYIGLYDQILFEEVKQVESASSNPAN